MWERDEMRREGACEVGGKRDATWEASRQPSVFMLTRRAAVFAAMSLLLIAVDRGMSRLVVSSLGRLVVLTHLVDRGQDRAC